MAIEIPVGDTDDPAFLELLNSLLRGLVAARVPRELWVVRIDNWFDHKWLRFSGRGVVDFQFPSFMNTFDAALDEFYQDRLTFPPFSPSRVLGQWSFVIGEAGYVEVPLPALPHATERQRSQSNLQRRVQDFSPSACFVWYSSNSQRNGKASIMVYTAEAKDVASWFASFTRRERWTLSATKGANMAEVRQLVTLA